ncbi:hypothetical protein [Commensalibacter oyaizuii]|uniref:Beta/gamma crystallin 'Greek key' domain-containing protein n=1 Tax=Commensalibacter oyaizuii TaxID=3043873 RepID=A0ABT6PY38_9PROT|nr:hypothetical protein [Commensalibacter sp. TBRC 16381]MDI2089780.1 hypothetical protein [Commensalibacter sp. TBRC 16381]
MKLNYSSFVAIIGIILSPSLTYGEDISTNVQEPQQLQTNINMVAYEHKSEHNYQIVAYMPYYPAYGMVSFRSPTCTAEITGYIDPFALKKNKLIITYKQCKVSFDQVNQTLTNPTESSACEQYRPKECSFTNNATLNKIPLDVQP